MQTHTVTPQIVGIRDKSHITSTSPDRKYYPAKDEDPYTLKVSNSLCPSSDSFPKSPSYNVGLEKLFKGRQVPEPWIFGRHKLYPFGELGTGSYGRVIRAFYAPSSTGKIRAVAIKILPREDLRWFAREAHAMTVFNGTGIFPTLLTAGRNAESAFLVMVMTFL